MKIFNIYFLSGLLMTTSLLKAQTDEPGAVLLNKGLMNVYDISEGKTSIYIKGDMVANGESKIYIRDANVKLTGDLINNVDPGYHVFAGDEGEENFAVRTNGRFEFAGTTPQRIRGSADKENSYIYFPQSTVINNKNATDWKESKVTLQSNMGATMDVVIHKSGRLILDSQPATGFLSTHAHLLLKGFQEQVKYYDSANPNAPWGGIQVNLAVGTNQKGRLFGFASPYLETYADYFMFNFLSSPSPKGLFGDNGLLITNPQTVLQPGKGYIVGMELVDGQTYYTSLLDPLWATANYSHRATTLFEFGGFPYTAKNSIQVKSTQERYGNEILNFFDTSVTLKKGFNYLGNPFTTPLDMNSFVDNTNALDGDWKATIGAGSADVKNAFYVLSNGTGTYLGNDRFRFNASYLLGQKVGGTYELGNDQLGYETRDRLLIAPMQMFIVYSNKDNVSLTIPAGKRTHGEVNFLRSADHYPVDELLIQTTDTKTGGFDRLCVVFRNNASLRSDDLYDAVKIFNKSGGVNQIYTRSSDNKLLTTNVIHSDTKRLSMYFEPASETQQVELTAHRLSSLQSVQQVILEDTKTGKKTDLTLTPSYTFLSDSGDKPDRFVLHFSSTITSIEDAATLSPPTAYYASGIIYVHGLQSKDLGRAASVYNMQGQLLHKEIVKDISPCNIHKMLNPGIYIIKVEDNACMMKFTVP